MTGSYRFRTAAHWRMGASRGFAEVGDMLEGQAPLALRRDARVPPGYMIAAAACGEIRLLDPDGGRVRTLSARGLIDDGRLVALEAPHAMVANGRWLWVAESDRLLRYDAETLQWIDALAMPGLAGLASDGIGGVWTAASGDGEATIGHVDRWGVVRRYRETLPSDRPPMIAAAAAWVVVLTGGGAASRLVILARGKDPASFDLPASEAPCALAVQGEDILVLFADGRLMRFERDGVFAGDAVLPLPPGAVARGLVVVDDGLLLVASDGVLAIVPAPGDAQADRSAVFVTPTLTSPPGVPSGWRRADLDVTLPEGATMRVRVAASDSAALLALLDAAFAVPPASRPAAVDALIPWRDRDRSYRGRGLREIVPFLLDELPEANLWLRIEIVTPAGVAPAVLHGLTIGYPQRRWIDHLPALYRENRASAGELHRFLAPIERLFEDLDTQIAADPTLFDPATAPDDRIAVPLAWLGFPPVDTLGAEIGRALLARAGDLLVGRGTLDTLRTVLAIVTRDRAEAVDGATEAFLWVLGGHGALPARLGRDTRIVSGGRTVFRLGRRPLRDAGRLGENGCVDLATLAGAACGTVRIRIAVPAAERATLAPVIDALLAMFVPAQCRIDLRYVAPGTLPAGDRLDLDAALDAEAGARLGEASRPGRWRLPACDRAPRLDSTALLESERRLA